MAITATSTLDDMMQQYAANASYQANGSLSEARDFHSACLALILKLPQTATGFDGGNTIQMSPVLMRDEARRAEQWIAAQSDAPRHVSFADFRR